MTLAVSRVALAKEHVTRPRFDDRIEIIRRSVAPYAQIDVEVTDQQLVADIAAGFDVVVMGADKWHQIQDLVFYNNNSVERDNAWPAFPKLPLIPRPPLEVPAGQAVLAIEPQLASRLDGVSSSLAREGQRGLMTPEARAFDEATGAWSAPDRYERYLVERGDD